MIAIFLIAAVLRLYDLNLVPLHHDEGVNGNFLVRLVREGAYTYDPANYHGPTLYYFSAIIPWITKLLFGNSARDNYGLTTFTIRLVPVRLRSGNYRSRISAAKTIGNYRNTRRGLDAGGLARRGLSLALFHSRDACLCSLRWASSWPRSGSTTSVTRLTSSPLSLRRRFFLRRRKRR